MPDQHHLFLQRILPKKWFAILQKESEQWMLGCPSCRRQISVWENGGIRAFAYSTRKTIRGRCFVCKKFVPFSLYKK